MYLDIAYMSMCIAKALYLQKPKRHDLERRVFDHAFLEKNKKNIFALFGLFSNFVLIHLTKDAGYFVIVFLLTR